MVKLLYIDLFAGAGGTSTGVESAMIDGNNCTKVIACVNHDANAIASHAANHPEAMHFTEDIRTLELTELIKHTKVMRTLSVSFSKGLRDSSCQVTPTLVRITDLASCTNTLIDDTLC